MNNCAKLGSQPSFNGVSIDSNGAYIYSADSYGLNFRWKKSSDADYSYTSLTEIDNNISTVLSNQFKHINGYWNHDNFNNVNDTGIGNTTSGWTNKPNDCDGWGTLVSFRMPSARGIQLLYGWNNNAYYLRSYEASWESWKRIMFGSMSVSGSTLTITL